MNQEIFWRVAITAHLLKARSCQNNNHILNVSKLEFWAITDAYQYKEATLHVNLGRKKCWKKGSLIRLIFLWENSSQSWLKGHLVEVLGGPIKCIPICCCKNLSLVFCLVNFLQVLSTRRGVSNTSCPLCNYTWNIPQIFIASSRAGVRDKKKGTHACHKNWPKRIEG